MTERRDSTRWKKEAIARKIFNKDYGLPHKQESLSADRNKF